MTWDDLRARFPELEPVSGVPWLGNLCGCGLMMYGSREDDPEFRTFVKTRYFCIFGIPLLSLGSYRMGRTADGFWILGREPLSTRAVWLNIVVLLAALGGGSVYGVQRLITSDWYLARRQLDRADSLVAAGHVEEAVGVYEGVAAAATDYAPVAAARLADLLERPAAPLLPADTAALLRTAARVQKAGRWPRADADLYNTGMSRVNALAASDPRGAVLILESVAPLAPKGDDPSGLARDLLERIVAAAPGDVAMVSRLAVLYEAQNQLDRCARLLEPLRPKLGESEGARILGAIDARAGRREPALTLLRGYTRPRLDRLRQAENRLKELVRSTEERLAERIRSRQATDFAYDDARGASNERLQELFMNYVNQHLKNDPEVVRAEAAYESEAGVARVALELGMLLLEHAQGLTEPEARKQTLAEAEATFVSVQRMAGESAEYQLSLGQVYYWEGKVREGRAEFDKLIAARGRPPQLLYTIADLLREVGSVSEARELAEEGYRSANDVDMKNRCATLRGLLETDLDAQVDWLKKGQSDHPFARALLATGLGYQTLRQGDEAAAVQHLQEAARLYQGLPDSPAKLNNGFGVLRELARLTGDDAAYERAADMIARAATLEPGNSLTQSNAARARLEAAMRDLIGPSLDLKLLRVDASLSMLNYLYDDQAERAALVQRVANHPGVARFLAMQQKVMLLAPRNPDSYMDALRVYEFLSDRASLQALHRRVTEADLDLSDELKPAKEEDQGAHEDRDRESWTAALKRMEATLSQARSQGRGATCALAIDMLVAGQITTLSLGKTIDPDALVALAEDAYQMAPSRATQSMLITALLARADGRLAGALPEYAQMRDRTRRTVAAGSRVAALLSVDGPLTATLAADPDTRRAAELVRIEVEKRPDEAQGYSWALSRVTQPEVASRVARAYATREVDRLEREVRERLEPYDAHTALSAFWAHTMAGRSADAAAALKAYTAHGLPLPIEAP
jgi:tetratricopeptide (TPR) repeat protein